jgi:hypothetical protein
MLLMLTSMLYGGLRGALAAIAAAFIQYDICAHGWAFGILPLRFVPQFNNNPHGVFVWLRAGAGQLMGSAAIAAIVLFVMRHERQINAAPRAKTVRACCSKMRQKALSCWIWRVSVSLRLTRLLIPYSAILTRSSCPSRAPN